MKILKTTYKVQDRFKNMSSMYDALYTLYKNNIYRLIYNIYFIFFNKFVSFLLKLFF